jgi:hypothetical protein
MQTDGWYLGSEDTRGCEQHRLLTPIRHTACSAHEDVRLEVRTSCGLHSVHVHLARITRTAHKYPLIQVSMIAYVKESQVTMCFRHGSFSNAFLRVP